MVLGAAPVLTHFSEMGELIKRSHGPVFLELCLEQTGLAGGLPGSAGSSADAPLTCAGSLAAAQTRGPQGQSCPEHTHPPPRLPAAPHRHLAELGAPPGMPGLCRCTLPPGSVCLGQGTRARLCSVHGAVLLPAVLRGE